jgi:hypothetical protein
MATAEARALTLAHREAQAQLSAQTVAELLALWPLVDWRRLADTYPVWVEQVAALIARQRVVSASLAGAYLRAFRAAQGIPGNPVVALAGAADQSWIDTSLRVTAGLSLKKLSLYPAEGFMTEKILANAFVRSSGAVQRIVADAGRTTIEGSVLADKTALGYTRIIHGRTCAFCAMLATRGPVYKSRQTASFALDGHRYHDHCDCTAEPLYEGMEYDPQADVKALNDLYASSAAGTSGKASIHAFAKAYYAR